MTPIKSTFLLVTALSSSAIYANDLLDRMEIVGEKLSSSMYEAMIEQVEANGADTTTLRTLIPDTSWNDDMRTAATCILDAYEEKVSADTLETMLDEVEKKLTEIERSNNKAEILEGAVNMQPDAISTDEMIAINNQCGMTKIVMENQQASAFVQELMRLTASDLE